MGSPKHSSQGFETSNKRNSASTFTSPRNPNRNSAHITDPFLEMHSPTSQPRLPKMSRSYKRDSHLTSSKEEEQKSAYLAKLDNLTSRIFPQEKGSKQKSSNKDDPSYIKLIGGSPREPAGSMVVDLKAFGVGSPRQHTNVSVNLNEIPTHKQTSRESLDVVNDENNYSKYLRTDSKMNEIIVLRKQNKQLTKKVEELQKELDSISEFKIAIEKPFDENNFNERRVTLLKAQIAQQRRLISKLTKSLKLSKTFHKELLAIMDIFKALCAKYQDKAFLKDKDEKPRESMMMKTENERLNILNENQKKKMLDLILAEADGPEMVEKFVKTFSEAYDKVNPLLFFLILISWRCHEEYIFYAKTDIGPSGGDG